MKWPATRALLLKGWPRPAAELTGALELVRNAESQAAPQG